MIIPSLSSAAKVNIVYEFLRSPFFAFAYKAQALHSIFFLETIYEPFLSCVSFAFFICVTSQITVAKETNSLALHFLSF